MGVRVPPLAPSDSETDASPDRRAFVRNELAELRKSAILCMWKQLVATRTSLPEGTGQMKKMLLIIALALLLVPSLAAAQYAGYGYYYPEYSTPQYYRQYAGPRGYPDQFYYRQMPPRVYRNWNHYNRMADQEALERSPLNPESSLQYLFRSF